MPSISVTGLSAGTTYYIHYLQTDAASNDSNQVTSASFTTDTDLSVTATTGSLTLTKTNAVVVASNNLDVTATTGSLSLTATNAVVTLGNIQSVSLTGLPPNTTLYIHYLQSDAEGNDSAQVTSTSFTTDVLNGNITATSVSLSVTPTNTTIDAQGARQVTATTGALTVTATSATIVTDVSLDLNANTDSLATATTSGVIRAQADYQVQETLNAVKTTGSVFENFTGTIDDGSLVYYPTANNTAISATGILTTDASNTFTIEFWDASNDTWSSFDATIGYGVTSTTNSLTLTVSNTTINTEADVNVVATTDSLTLNSTNPSLSIVSGNDLSVTVANTSLSVNTTNTTIDASNEANINSARVTLIISETNCTVAAGVDTVIPVGSVAITLQTTPATARSAWADSIDATGTWTSDTDDSTTWSY